MDDIPEVPEAIVLTEDHLEDTSLNYKFPLNETAREIIKCIDHKNKVSEITTIISGKYDADYKMVSHDVVTLLELLYERSLLNVKRAAVIERFKLFLHYMFIRNFRGMIDLLKFQKRHDISVDKRRPVQVFGQTMLVMTYVYMFWWVLFSILFVFTTPLSVIQSLIFMFNFVFSLVMHEYSHIIGLYLTKQIHSLGYFKSTFFTIGVTRESLSPKKEIVVSLLGPLIPTIIGITLIILGLTLKVDFLIMLSWVWVINIFALIFTDGKSIVQACGQLLLNRKIRLRRD